MDLYKLDNLLNKRLDKITKQIQAKIFFPNPTRGGYPSKSTGFLERSIRLEAKKGQIIFYTPSVVRYAKYQDEGTYGRRQSTRESRRAWNTTVYKRGRPNTGIHPQHFTDPLKALTAKEIVTTISPAIVEAMTKEINLMIKKYNSTSK